MAEENPYNYGGPLKCEGNVLICNILPEVHVFGISKAFLRLSNTPTFALSPCLNKCYGRKGPFTYYEGMVVARGGVEDEAPSTPTVGEGLASP